MLECGGCCLARCSRVKCCMSSTGSSSYHNIQAERHILWHMMLFLLHKSRCRTLLHHQWMSVHTGHQTQSDRSPYSFGYLPLVLRSQASLARVLYPSCLGHVFGHYGEVLHCISLTLHPCQPPRLALYSNTGLTPRMSNASSCVFFFPYFHFFCSTPDKSCGAYTSPGCHLRNIWRWN